MSISASHAFRIARQNASRTASSPIRLERVGDEGAGEQRARLGAAGCRGWRGRRARRGRARRPWRRGRISTSSAKISSSGLALIVAVRARSRPLQRLLAVGLLRAARDLDPRRDRAGRLVVGDRAPDLAARAARRGVADDEVDVMALAAAGEQRAAGLGIGALAGERDRRRRAGCRRRRPPRMVTTRLAPSPSSAWSVRLTKPSSLQQPPRQHQPRALAEGDAGQAVGPARADEGLDDRGLGVGVERDLRRRDDRRRRSRHGRSGRGRPAHDRGRAAAPAARRRPAAPAHGRSSTSTGPSSMRPGSLRRGIVDSRRRTSSVGPVGARDEHRQRRSLERQLARGRRA